MKKEGLVLPTIISVISNCHLKTVKPSISSRAFCKVSRLNVKSRKNFLVGGFTSIHAASCHNFAKLKAIFFSLYRYIANEGMTLVQVLLFSKFRVQ